MSQQSNQMVKSFLAGDTLSAYRIVAQNGTNNTVDLASLTSAILGVTLDAADSGTAIAVVIGGTAKVQLNSSVGAGSPVAAQAGLGTATSLTFNTTTSALPTVLGIALESGSTNSIIEVQISPVQRAKLAFA